ncbi:MAG: DUF3006 domain-containing protein [Eubacteriales bacterium]|jgi:hypothetical protein
MYIVDRIEGAQAVCEALDHTLHSIPLEQLPAGTAEGDCLEWVAGRWIFLPEITQERRARLAARRQKLTRTHKDP